MCEDSQDYRAEHADVPLFAKLKREAVEIANSRHHILRRFGPTRSSNGGFATTAECKLCEGTVQVKTRPQPNEIEVGGNALALSCLKSKVPNTTRIMRVSLNPKRKPHLHGMNEHELRVYIRKLERRLMKMQHTFMDVVNLTEQFAFEDQNLG